MSSAATPLVLTPFVRNQMMSPAIRSISIILTTCIIISATTVIVTTIIISTSKGGAVETGRSVVYGVMYYFTI